MSTVKIKTEPTTATAAAAAAVAVKVKLEPSLSTADIKLEQHTSDIDTKVESDSEDDSEEEYIKSESDDGDDEDTDQNQRRFICEYPGCNCRYKLIGDLKRHQHEHRLQTWINIHGKTYILGRQSLNDRWICPILDCEMTSKTIDALRCHIRAHHGNAIEQQQQPVRFTRYKYYFLDVDDFYVNGVRCGYYNTIGVFICHECRLVPECLLTHLQQKHGYGEKLIDNSALPDNAVNANADPNINQHTSNTHLAAAISRPYRQRHPDIAQGWLCVTSDCGYCGYAASTKRDHRKNAHQSERIITVQALALRLAYTKSNSCYFLIVRIDQITTSSSRVSRHKLDYSHSGLKTQDENGDDTSQNESTDESNQRRQWKCEYHNCGQLFNTAKLLSVHRREHKLEVVINVQSNSYTLSRQSLDDRWECPVPDCEATCKTAQATYMHIQKFHGASMNHKRANNEDYDNSQQQQQQQNSKRRQFTRFYLKVDEFYVNGARCGYHTTTGVFLCYECRLVPECLLTHLQQKHAFDEKSITNSALPESAVNASASPNINQHTSNAHLASAISQPYQQQHPDIVQGWLCITSNCGYCGYSANGKSDHKKSMHHGEQIITSPALVLRLYFGKIQSSSFLITRLDTATNNSSKSDNSANHHDNECDDEDDGDELVLSDMGSDDDIH